MARIRSIKPEFWDDMWLAQRASRDARLLYIALWNHSDEWARCHGDPRWVKGRCFPFDDDLNLNSIDLLLRELETSGRLVRYTVKGVAYLFLPKLPVHQRLEPNKTPSRLPEPTIPTSELFLDSSAFGSEESAGSPEESGTIVVQQVASSREQVASSREQGGEVQIPDSANERVAAIYETWKRAVHGVGASHYGLAKNVKTEVRDLLNEGAPFDQVLRAAHNAGKGGFSTISKQLQIDMRPARSASPSQNGSAAILARAEQRFAVGSSDLPAHGATLAPAALPHLPGPLTPEGTL